MENLYSEIKEIRKRWISERKFLLDSESLSQDDDIRRLDTIMEEITGLTFNDLRNNFDFRFSAAIIRGGMNRDNYVLTLPTHKETGKYALPGGKIDVTKMPFSSFLFSLFWKNNRVKYEDNVFMNGDYNAPLTHIVDRNAIQEIDRYVVPLEDLAGQMDFPFDRDTHSDIRREGYRELEEEMDLQKPSRKYRHELSGTRAFIQGARRIGIFLDRYRVAHPTGEEVAKRWFVSFNYHVLVNGSRKLITETVEKGIEASGEAEGIRWASLPEVRRQGYEAMYHDTVHYVAVRLHQLGMANTDARHGRIKPRLRSNPIESDSGLIEVKNPLR